MLYQYVKRYLKNSLTKPTIDFEWSTLDNIKFFSHIEKRYTLKEFSKELSEAKEAFRDFFEPIGSIVFRYKEDGEIKVKIFPYRVKAKDSKHLKNIIKIIKENKKHIQYPYQGQNDQIAIWGKIRREINREVFHTQESIKIKELIRYAIKIALNLDDKDIITQLKRKYIVKIFEKNTILTADAEAPIKREGKQNRFNGYTAEQIEETYKEIFTNGDADINEFLVSVMQSAFRDSLDFNSITNKYYELNALKIIHTAIAKEIHNYISLEEDYILGITGYLMRVHFQKIHELMARKLIKSVYEKNENAKHFLLYYNGSTRLVNGKKHQVPSLTTEDGRQWNNASLIGICNLWMNTKRKKEQYENKLHYTNIKIEKLKKTLPYVKLETDHQGKAIEKTKIADLTDLDFYINQKQKLLHDLKAQELNIDSKNAQIDPILRSIAKVLMERTKIIE